jgi:F-type H+-transporting ATPase subunit b
MKDSNLQEHIEHSSHDTDHSGPEGGFFTPEINLLILTWIVFFLLLIILKKYAWGPILNALDKREKDIEESLKNADYLKEELEKINEKQDKIIDEAQVKSKEIIEQARKAAIEATHTIKEKAKEETQILMENAERQIKNEKEKALAQLKEESINIAVELASKLIHENLDSEKNRKLVNDYIKEI